MALNVVMTIKPCKNLEKYQLRLLIARLMGKALSQGLDSVHEIEH